MPLQIRIPGVDFGATSLPQFRKRVAGFDAGPQDKLDALYLFEDGAVGDVVSRAYDSSGNAQHGAIHTGSAALTRTAGGVLMAGGAETRGAWFDTGIDLRRSHTIFGVIRQDNVFLAGTNLGFPTFFTATEVLPATVLTNHLHSNPAYTMNMSFQGTTAAPRAQMFRNSPIRWGAEATGPVLAQDGLKPTGYYSMVASIDAVSKLVTFKVGAATTSGPISDMLNEPAINDILAAASFKASFGHGPNTGELTQKGGFSLFGIYGRYMNLAQCEDLISRMQARMAARGVAID